MDAVIPPGTHERLAAALIGAERFDELLEVGEMATGVSQSDTMPPLDESSWQWKQAKRRRRAKRKAKAADPMASQIVGTYPLVRVRVPVSPGAGIIGPSTAVESRESIDPTNMHERLARAIRGY